MDLTQDILLLWMMIKNNIQNLEHDLENGNMKIDWLIDDYQNLSSFGNHDFKTTLDNLNYYNK